MNSLIPMTTRMKQSRPSVFDWDMLNWPFETLDWFDSPKSMAMRTEEYVDENTFVVRCELPGMNPDEDVRVTTDGGILTITAERREEISEGEAGKSNYRSEFRYGSYRRDLTLPRGTVTEDIKATYSDGILEIRLPLKNVAGGPKQITITHV